MEMIRYRPASSVPGKNRLSELEGEVPSRGDLELLLGVRTADRGVAGIAVATVRVANSWDECASASIFCPQVEQKRLFSAITLAQDGHSFMADVFHDRTRADAVRALHVARVCGCKASRARKRAGALSGAGSAFWAPLPAGRSSLFSYIPTCAGMRGPKID